MAVNLFLMQTFCHFSQLITYLITIFGCKLFSNHDITYISCTFSLFSTFSQEKVEISSKKVFSFSLMHPVGDWVTIRTVTLFTHKSR